MNRLKERTDAQMFTSFVFPVSYIMLYNHVFCIFKIVTPHSALLEKAMAPHSGTLAWKIPWTEGKKKIPWKAAVYWVAEGRTRLGDFTFTFMHWRRRWQPTLVFLPGEFQGRGSLVGCCPWGRTELDMTEVT